MVLEYVEVVPRAEGVPVPPEPRVPQFRPKSLAIVNKTHYTYSYNKTVVCVNNQNICYTILTFDP